MNKETWVKHIEETSGLFRPSSCSLTGDRKRAFELWKNFLKEHSPNCRLCADRKKTRERNRMAREQNQILRELCGTSARAARKDMGLVQARYA